MDAKRLDALTGLRFFAAIWVMLFHYREITPTWTYRFPIVDPWIAMGGLGVDLFFVLSGFILCHVYSHKFEKVISRDDYINFMLFRVARLYPVHIATFMFMIILIALQALFGGSNHPERYTLLMVLSSLTMTHAWFTSVITPNMPAWSISAEFFAYIFFPFAYFASSKYKIFFYITILISLTISILMSPPFDSTFAFNESLFRVTAGFLFGMAAFKYRHMFTRIVIFNFGSLIVVAIIVFWIGIFGDFYGPIGLLLFSFLILSLTNENDWLSRAMSNRFIVMGGVLSFGMYMLHWPVRIVLREILTRSGVIYDIPAYVTIFSYCSVTLFLSYYLHRMIEEPGRQALRRLSPTI